MSTETDFDIFAQGPPNRLLDTLEQGDHLRKDPASAMALAMMMLVYSTCAGDSRGGALAQWHAHRALLRRR